MTKHITVGFDGSPESREALRWAAEEALARACSLNMVTCYQVPITGDVYSGWAPTEAYGDGAEAASMVLEPARQATHVAYPGLEITAAVTAGHAADALVEDRPSDEELIVLGASSHKGASAFWLGSTPRSVVRHARCPVVVVRGATSRGKPDRVVVGVDASDGARRALHWAAAEADLHHAALVVVHAWEYPYEVTNTTTRAQARDFTRVDAASVLDGYVELARELCGSDVSGQLIEASPTTALLDIADDNDLLVVGSRGRGAVRTGVFGSTVNSLLDRAAVPVAVVRGDER